jgi:eukaryotic-like serine/threonine-protein kinase
MLAPGDEVTLRSSGAVYAVGRVLGAGGQGTVFEAVPQRGGAPVALKWYRSAAATRGQAARLERILDAGRPSEAFLWPLEMVARSRAPGFGYVMPQRRDPFQPLTRVMNGYSEMPLRASCVAAARLADAFLRLHARGLCYADISLNNVFVDVGSGDVQICDNDNVTVDGDPSEVLGTPYFMAPEIVRGEALPSTFTDRYSLAVILFFLLLRHHPLFGARESAAAVLDGLSLTRLLGTEPVFVFDPDDLSNRPVPHLHDNAILRWPALPGFVRDMFVQAFTVGLSEPMHGRVTESQWRAAMVRLRGLVRHCPVCGTEQFWDPDDPEVSCAAPDCRAPMPQPLRLLARHATVLEPGLLLTTGDLGSGVEPTESTIGDVVRHPATRAPALRNRTGDPWVLHRQDGDIPVPPKAAALVKPSVELTIGGTRFRFAQ